MIKVRYLAPARSELRGAAHYYRERSLRVASSFMSSVQDAINHLVQFPESAPIIRVISRFPYILMYRLEDDVILVLAVAHQKQRPEYWIDRDA